VESAVTLLVWNRLGSIGVRAMDDQHGVLMDTLADLRLALVQGAGRDRVRKEMRRLVEFTRMHFDSEERLLEQQGFPELAAHRDAHERLLGLVCEVAKRAEHTDGAEMLAAAGVLRGWYTEHVEQLDRGCGEWLNERGIV
jgi:hemerythrin